MWCFLEIRGYFINSQVKTHMNQEHKHFHFCRFLRWVFSVRSNNHYNAGIVLLFFCSIVALKIRGEGVVRGGGDPRSQFLIILGMLMKK